MTSNAGPETELAGPDRYALGRSGERAEGALDALDEHLVSLLAPASFEAEQYRALRHVVERMRGGSLPSVVGITSPGVEDGKTTTAINLAGALAQSRDARVLLVEADLRRPSVGEYLGMPDSGRPGLVDAILDPGLALEEAVWRPGFNLSVLLAGRRRAAPYEVLSSRRLGDLLQEARGRYSHIVLDTPPLIPVLDSRLIEKWVDGLLVVVTAHRTPRRLVEEALNVLDPGKVVGLVFNGGDPPLSGYCRDSGHSPDGSRTGWWGRALSGIGRFSRRRGGSRRRRARSRSPEQQGCGSAWVRGEGA